MSDNLNPEQRKAVETVQGPLLIIAGAGSGKTRVLTARIARMISLGIRPSEILALTFTNKAAREMEERIKKAVGSSSIKELAVSTFHSFGMRVLRREARHLGYRSGFSIYDSTDKISCIREAAQEIKMAVEPGELNPLANLFSAIKTSRSNWDETTLPYKTLYEEYQKHLLAYNAVDFDDLIVLPNTLFRENPSILDRYRNRYRYILVDEFQDTSHIQYDLLKMIAETNRNICCVGDDDQSIYSWRGADYGNITSFEKDFPERIEIKLERNYRSTGAILRAANSVINNNENRKPKELIAALDLKERAIRIAFPENDAEEARFISDAIKRLRHEEAIGYGDIGVLVRTNSLMKNIETEFLETRIPYVISGGFSFFQRMEIKDILSYLRVIINPADDVNLLRIINTPRRGVGRKALELLTARARGRKECLYYTAKDIVFSFSAENESLRQGLADLIHLIEEFIPRFEEKGKLAENMLDFVEEIGYWDHLLGIHKESQESAVRKYDNIKSLARFLERWENNPDFPSRTLAEWLNRVALITRDELADDDEGKVNLMTIHAAKGLEFDAVFLPGVEEGIIPHARSVEELAGDVEEERRLFYVAITRAKLRLTMTSCAKRRRRNEEYSCMPSPFIDELPEDVVTTEEVDVEENESEDERIEKIMARMPWNR